jgi:peptidoglycan/LPS O-acetylase OafA/YrhL
MISQPGSSLTYLPQLDSLRAIAVSMVIFSHWAGYHNDAWRDTFWFNGQVGVQLFFVLSGFLITGILLEEKHNAVSVETRRVFILKAFYVRRMLRIFPLFYATLFIAYYFGQPDVVMSVKWHLAYLSNVFFAMRGEYLETVSHFWSLAVEEQFYLVWPLLILILPQRYLAPGIVLSIVLAPIFRYFTTFTLGWNEVAVNVSTFSSMDTLGAGALLALLMREPRRYRGTMQIIGFFCGTSAIVFLTMGMLGLNGGFGSLSEYLFRCVQVPALLGVVWIFVRGFPSGVSRYVCHPVLVYTGRISYGIYILHFFVPYVTSTFFYDQEYLFWEEVGVIPYLVLNLTLLVAVCSVSWFFFESRIIALKSYFPYVKHSYSSMLNRNG